MGNACTECKSCGQESKNEFNDDLQEPYTQKKTLKEWQTAGRSRSGSNKEFSTEVLSLLFYSL